MTDIGAEVHDLAVALGVLDAGGGLRPGFFANPLGQAAGVLRDPARRAALRELIGDLAPPDRTAPAEPGAVETWHLLTDAAAPARVYLTVRPTSGGGMVLGLALRVGSSATTGDGAGDGHPAVALTLAAGLVEATDGGLRSVVGTPTGPVRARLDVTAGAGQADSAGFEAVSLDAALTPGVTARPVSLTIAVRGLRVDGEVQPPIVVDATRLDRGVVPLLQRLVEDRLRDLAAETSVPDALAALAHHLLPLLGLAGDVPRLPLDRIGAEPAALGAWFARVLDTVPAGGGPAGSAWLGHLAGLLGAAGPPTGSGTEADPWQVPVARLAGGSRIEVTLATHSGPSGRELLVGVTARLDGPNGVAVDADATLVSLPLTGTAPPRALPAAAVLVRAPADPAGTLVATDQLRVGSARGGLRWDGAVLRPVLELTRVTFDGHDYDVVDLGHVDSVRAAAAAAVRAALADALGAGGPGAHLAVLLGLLAPAGEQGAPLADPVALLTGPTREVARVHRARLTGSGHPWAAMLAELAALLGATDPVAGAGSADDPWHVALVTAGPLSLDLTAWTAAAAGPVPELHLGLRLAGEMAFGMATVAGTVDAELVAAAFPAGAPVTTELVARHAARLALTGPFVLSPLEGTALSVGGAGARIDWRPGQAPEAVVELTGLTVHLDDADVTVPALRLPPASGFAPDQPDLGLGIPVADLDRVVRALLARLWQARAGDVAGAASGLLGLTPEADLPEGWPALALPEGGLGGLLSAPLAALREWLARVVLDLSAEGAPFVPVLLDGLRRLVRPDATTADVDVDVPGAGTWSAPWRIELGTPGASQLLLWLEPDGPPGAWAEAAAARATSLGEADLLAIMGRFGAAVPPLAAVFGAADGPAQADRLAGGLATLVRELSDGDGVVPLTAQLPSTGGWAIGGTVVDAAHHRLPEHPDAVAQVLAEVAARAPGTDRTVVLVGPPFTGRSSWQPLLAAAEAARPGATDPGAHFDLRTPPTPDRADLAATTAVASWYTVDLADAGGPLDPVVAQIAAVVGRVRELRGGKPVVLVAHSTAGLAARAFTAAHPQQVAGLLTIGTPHGPAPLTALDDSAGADALRLAARLLGAAGATGPVRDAVDHLLAAEEGWQATATLPAPLAFPSDRFAGEGDHGTGGVPALAIAGRLGDDVLGRLGGALGQALVASGGGAGGAQLPSHLGVGLRIGTVPAPPAGVPSGITVDVGLRLDAARIPLGALADPHAAPPPRVAVEVRLERPGGWLVDPAQGPAGGPGIRVRRAELGVVVEVGAGARPVQATAVFHDAGIDAPAAGRVTLADPGGARLLGAVVAEVAAAGDADGAAASLVDALVAVGLATRDGAGAVSVAVDAVDAMVADPAGFLGSRARAALAAGPGGGLLGVAGPPAGPWTAAHPDLPLGLELGPDHLMVRVAALEVAGAVVSGELTWTAGATAPHISLTIAGASASGPSLRWDTAAGSLVLVPGPSSDPVTLVPNPGASALAEGLGTLLVERLVAAVAGTALLDRLGPGWELGPITELLRRPERLLLTPAGPGGPLRLDGDRIGALLGLLGELIGLPGGSQGDGGGTPGGGGGDGGEGPGGPGGPALSGAIAVDTAAADAGAGGAVGLTLPGGLVLQASGQPCRVSLRTAAPFPVPGPGDADGALSVELDLTVPDLATTPGLAGQIVLDLPLGGTWGAVTVTLGLDGGTVSLAVGPRTADGTPLAPVVLLPRFGGLGPLAADAAALLPALLDALVARLPQPRPPVASAVLAVADALGIHGGPGDPNFAAHVPALRHLAGGTGLSAMARSGLPAAIVQLWQAAGLPGTVTPKPDGVAVAAPFGGVTVKVDAGWGTGPLVGLRVEGLAAGPLALGPVEARLAGGTVTGGLTATFDLPPEAEQLLGLRLAPSLVATLDADGPAVTFRPLGPGVEAIEAHLLPTPRLELDDGGLAALLEQVLLPLAAQAVIDRVDLDRPLVTGGPTAAQVLRSAGVLAAGAPRLAVPLPALDQAVPRILAALAATGITVPLDDDLALTAVTDRSVTPARLGLGLHGHTASAGESVRVSLRLGEDAPTWLPDPAPALRLLLVEEGTWRLRPSLRLAPLGVRVEGPEGSGTGAEALVDTEDVHLGAVTAYLWADMNLDGGLTLGGIGGAVDLDDLGLPLGAVTAGSGGANPVAASLLGSGGTGDGTGAGDRQAVTPGISLVAARRPGNPFALLRREDDRWVPFAQRPLWFGVHRSFGPLAVDQIGFSHTPATAGSGRPGTAAVLVDGGVQVGPLTVQAHELGVSVPLDRLDQPEVWQLDLAGLAVAFRSDAVALSGGLVKRPGPPLDYAGTVTVQVAGRTFTAVGAYGRPHDQQGAFTSLFVFAGLPTVLGGPPPMFVTGLGGGAGYNRRLVPPAQITDVPRFPLVTAIDDGVNSDPAGTLARMGAAMPPQRGSIWLAAGLRFTSFSFVRSIGVLYVSLDRNVEIGLLGVARASIPPPDAGAGSLELASVELALRARFSPAEGVLSIQAQLTDHSWLLSRDCQLTGGFAFFVWFRRDQFVLTLGGYHPSFVRPAEFPVVPRLGFHWAVSDAVVVKGESYFALTSSCVMAGGRLEVAYRKSGIYASFTAYADFLISWDPFHYDVRVGVSVSAGFRIRVCFFACVTIDVHITLGASVHLLGPPLRGEATLDLEVCSVTVAFGHGPHAPPTFMGWDGFRAKYVVAGAADGSALSLQATAGLIPPDGPAVAPAGAPGSQANPWRVAGNFSLRSETRLAATRYAVNGHDVHVPLGDGVRPVPARLAIGPMNVTGIDSVHDVTVTAMSTGQEPAGMSRLVVEAVVGHVPAAVWTISDHPVASAETVPVLTGLVISGQPTVASADERPPISVEVIDFNVDPVPIGLVAAGRATVRRPAAAELERSLADLVTHSSARRLASVGAQVLGPAGTAARTRAGLAPAPLAARSLRTLHTRRSSPPLITSLGASPVPAPPSAPTAPAGASTAEPVTVGGAMEGSEVGRLGEGPRLRARLVGPAGAVPPPSPDPDAASTAGVAVGPAPATRAAVTGRTLVATEWGSSTPGAPQAAAQGSALAGAGSVVAPGEVQVWDLPPGGRAGRWLVSGPGAARVVFLDAAGHPLEDHDVTPAEGQEVAVTAPPDAVRATVAAVGSTGPAISGWQAGSLLAQVGPTTLLAPGATVHLPGPLLTRRDGLRTAQALVRAATAVAPAGTVETRLPAGTEVVVVIVDATAGTEPGTLPEVSIDGAAPGEPTVVAGGHRLYLAFAVPHGEAGRAVQVATGADWTLAGVLGGPGTVGDWLPAITGAGSGVTVPPRRPTAPVTVRYEAPDPREAP